MSAVIRLGYIDRGFQKAAAIEVENVLVACGHRVLRQNGRREDMFKTLSAGDIDLLVTAWLPDTDGELLAQYGTNTELFGTLYCPRYVWAVPDYVPEAELGMIPDLAKPEIVDRIGRQIEALAGGQVGKLSRAVLERYRLDQAGYVLDELDEEHRIGRFVEDHAEHRWSIIPIWQPHWLHHRYKVRALRDPLGVLETAERAVMLAHRKTRDRICEETLAALRTLHLATDRLSELDDHLQPWD